MTHSKPQYNSIKAEKQHHVDERTSSDEIVSLLDES
jgi:hypothetical protein